MTSDEIRHRLVEHFEAAKQTLNDYYDYARGAAALSEEYHAARIKECFKTAEYKEMTLVAEFDSRETPATLDRKLAELGDLPLKLVVYSQAKNTYYLFI